MRARIVGACVLRPPAERRLVRPTPEKVDARVGAAGRSRPRQCCRVDGAARRAGCPTTRSRPASRNGSLHRRLPRRLRRRASGLTPEARILAAVKACGPLGRRQPPRGGVPVRAHRGRGAAAGGDGGRLRRRGSIAECRVHRTAIARRDRPPRRGRDPGHRTGADARSTARRASSDHGCAGWCGRRSSRRLVTLGELVAILRASGAPPRVAEARGGSSLPASRRRAAFSRTSSST